MHAHMAGSNAVLVATTVARDHVWVVQNVEQYMLRARSCQHDSTFMNPVFRHDEHQLSPWRKL